MTVPRVNSALNIWRARRSRTLGDRAYTVYLMVMVGLAAVMPVARAVWMSASSQAGVTLLAGPLAPTVAMVVVAGIWAGALFLGRERGPALYHPFLAHALGLSEVRRSSTFWRPVVRAAVVVGATTTATAALIGASLLSAGAAGLGQVVGFVLVAFLCGVIATVCWLFGQVMPGWGVVAGVGIVAGTALSVLVPQTSAFLPWGWVAAAYPQSSGPVSGDHTAGDATATLTFMLVIAGVLAAAVPMLLNRLRFQVVATQSSRWAAATTHTLSLDMSSALSTYQVRPTTGRSWQAVRRTRGLTAMIVLRDVVGATRTPGRLIAGVAAIGVAGALIALACVPAMPAWLLGAAAGLVLFAGLGPLTDGVRHAAQAASGVSLYGISDERLLLSHLVVPVILTVLVLAAVSTTCALLLGVPLGEVLMASLSLGITSLVIRVGTGLKGRLPAALLTPIPTPLGDMSIVVQLIWACEAVLIVSLAGAAAVQLLQTPLFMVLTAGVALAVAARRWQQRS